METTVKEEKVTNVSEGSKKKRTWWGAFVNFLAYGGFLLILVAIVAIVVLISILTK